MSDEKYSIKTDSTVTFSNSVSNLDRSIIFLVGGKKRLKIDKDGFYVDDRLVANDLEIYEAFKDWLNQATGLNNTSEATETESQDDK
tara:strand:- start:310 stop:570 length:261 start_codon:yes stop_codon:yes gene_type:complete